MYYFGYDPQTARGRFCTSCLCEHFELGDLCRKCSDRLDPDEIEWED